MNEAAALHLRRAKQALHAARVLLETGDVPDSISRSYYAALHAARAALAQVGEHPKTHRGTHDLLWSHFVQEGHLSRSVGRFLSDARDLRTDADYDVFSRFDTAAASDLLEDARRFIRESRSPDFSAGRTSGVTPRTNKSCWRPGMSLSAETREARAKGVEVTEDELTVHLEDGRSVTTPLAWYPRLVYATEEERQNFEIAGSGLGIYWPDLDEDLSVKGMLEGRPSGEGPRSLKRWKKEMQRRREGAAGV